MYQAACFAVILVLFGAWVVAELRARSAARISLGVAMLALVGAMWYTAELKVAQMEAHYHALFREMGVMLDGGDFRNVKRAVSVYNHPEPGKLRVFQAMDAIDKEGSE